MKPEDQIIATAEADGWVYDTRCENYKLADGTDYDVAWFPPIDHMHRTLPNYLEDINAIRAVVLKWKDKLVRKNGCMVPFSHEFPLALSELCGQDCDMGWGACTASAAQWCEAFLRTIGEWV